MDEAEFEKYTNIDHLVAYLDNWNRKWRPKDDDSRVVDDEKTSEEIRFENSVSRELFDKIYCYDVSVDRMYFSPDTKCTSLHEWLLPFEESNEYRKKAMYYSMSGHAFALVGCVDEAKGAFQQAKRVDESFPTLDYNIECLEEDELQSS